MEPETRTLFDAESEVADAYVQVAIPWCTTHNQCTYVYLVRDGEHCGGFDGNSCVVSSGGPDHKWWKDE